MLARLSRPSRRLSLSFRHFQLSSVQHKELLQRSLHEREGFWGEVARTHLEWSTPFTHVLDESRPPHYRWFPGGELNICYNAVDRHVEAGHGERIAIAHDSPLTGSECTVSYSTLQLHVAQLATALAQRGVRKGDRVLLYMPMIPETIVGMLACARLGAIHSVVFGGFGSNELAVRIEDAAPVAILTASCGFETGGRLVRYLPLLEGALKLSSHRPSSVLVHDRRATAKSVAGFIDDSLQLSTLDASVGAEYWCSAVKPLRSLPIAELQPCVPVPSEHPLYILYTSGTTGAPKGVVRDSGGHAAVLTWTMRHFFRVSPGEAWMCASDLGWVVGHSYIAYAPLLSGCTSILFEGKPVGTPDARALWRAVERWGAVGLFAAPTALRAIRAADHEAEGVTRHDLSSLRALFVAGERCDPPTAEWIGRALGIPVVDHWWQTETGSPICGFIDEAIGAVGGSTALPLPGYDVHAVDPQTSEPLPAGELGDLALKLPLAPGALQTLWHADQRFVDAYLKRHPGWYDTGDAGYVGADGYVHVMARTDDVINVAGHRLSTGALEEVMTSHPEVAECCVVGAADDLKGQLPLGLLVLTGSARTSPEDVEAQIVQMVREHIGPVAAFKHAIVLPALPKTRSGKILRGLLLKLADGQTATPPATLEDPEVFQEAARVISERWRAGREK